MSYQLQLKDLDLTIDDIKLMLNRYNEINNVISDKIIDRSIKYCDVRVLGDVPAGIMSSHFIIDVTLEDVNQNQSIWSCFVKRTLKNDFLSKYAKDLETFDKEGDIYQLLIPAMEDIAKGQKPWTAACYLTKNVDLIALENLNCHGFVPSISGRFLDMEHLKIVMQSLSRMNAASVALEVKRGQKIPEIFPNLLRENAYPTTDPPGYRQKGVQSMACTVQHIVKIMSEKKLIQYEKFNVDAIVNMIPSIFNELFGLVKPSKKFLNVFNQSDLWANNILFKYDGDCPIDCRLIDFQLSRYAPPAFDISTVLVTSTSRSFRELNASKLLDLYYKTLTDELEMFGLSVQQFLTKSELNESYEIYKKASLIESLCFFQTIYLPEEMWSDLIRTPQSFEDFVLNKHTEICMKIYADNREYRDKITEIIQELLDITLLGSKV